MLYEFDIGLFTLNTKKAIAIDITIDKTNFKIEIFSSILNKFKAFRKVFFSF